jgi:two-component system, NarL family, invasion response regulator UvrY
MSERMVSVAVADDHEMIRVGLAQVISTNPDMAVVMQFADAHQLFAADLRAIDVILLDLNMPGSTGVASVAALSERYPDLKIVVFSLLPEESFAPRALEAGARAYLSKNASPDEVLRAIKVLARERRYIPASQQKMMDASKTGESAPLHETLAQREFEILLLLAGGSKPTEIAERLGLQIGTVTTHIHRVKKKLGARSLGELIAYAHRHRLVGY